MGTEFQRIILTNFMLQRAVLRKLFFFVDDDDRWTECFRQETPPLVLRGTVIPEFEATEFSNYNLVYTTFSVTPKCKL